MSIASVHKKNKNKKTKFDESSEISNILFYIISTNKSVNCGTLVYT